MERLPSGDAVLKVSTPTSVSEPYLDLLVEVNWASGRVVRAYTFLLDPPGRAAPVAAVEPVAPVRAGAAPAPRAAAAPAPASEAAAGARPSGSASSAGAGGTYTVRRGDTLSKIANEYRPSSATLEQMLVALYANNKDAFDGNNMNRLRAGAILNIPNPDVAAAVAPTDATKTVRVQASDWRGYQDRVATSAPMAEGAGARATTGKIGTTVEEKAPAVTPGRDQLKVSPQAGVAKGAASAPLAEEVVSRDKALKEAQTRISELERTLRDLQKAIELKGQTGAQLQAQSDAAKAKVAEPASRTAPVASVPAVPRADGCAGSEGARTDEGCRGAEDGSAKTRAAAEGRGVFAGEIGGFGTREGAGRTEVGAAKSGGRLEGCAEIGHREAAAEARAVVLRRPLRWHARMGDRRRRARSARRHRSAHRCTPAQDGEVRGQHHRRHRHQDEHRVRLDRRRCRQHRREFARDGLQPRRSRQHRHR
jgi:FimV-like protein